VNWERFAAILSLILAAALALVLFFVPSRSPPPDSTATAPLPATQVHANRAGGFSFRSPVGWISSDLGTTTTLANADHSIVITFGPGSAPGLQEGSDELVGSMRREYRDVTLLERDQAKIQGSSALMVSGTGTNGSGVHIRFLAITVAGGDRTYDIGVFTDANADPAVVLPPAQQIVGSFQALVEASPASLGAGRAIA
jgi:hypothetical protein